MSRTEYAGAAPETTLTSSMTAGAPTSGQTFTVSSGTGYPTGSVGNFVIKVDAGTPSEEKILCSGRSGNTFTIATDGRGYDGTTAVSHGGGVTAGSVAHCIDATSLSDDQDHIYDTARDDHTQYLLRSLLTTQGDMPYATAAGVWARLAKGTAGQVLTMNGGATAPSWVTPSLANDAATVATAEGTNSTSYTDLATVGPAVTVTTGTKALVTVSARVWNNSTTDSNFMGFAVSGATTLAAADTFALRWTSPVANEELGASYAVLLTGLTAGSNVFTAKYRVVTAAGSSSWQNRRILVVDMGS